MFSKALTKIRFFFTWGTYLSSFSSRIIPSDILIWTVPIPFMLHGRSSPMITKHPSNFSKVENQSLFGHTWKVAPVSNNPLKVSWVANNRSYNGKREYRWVWVWSICLWSTGLSIDHLCKICLGLRLLLIFDLWTIHLPVSYLFAEDTVVLLQISVMLAFTFPIGTSASYHQCLCWCTIGRRLFVLPLTS